MLAATRLLFVVGMLAALGPAAPAQFVYGPPPGIGFNYRGGRVTVAGYLPFPPPYPVVQQRIVIQQIVPVVVAPRISPPEYDVTGIDLDVEPPSKLFGNNPPPGIDERGALAKLVPPPEKPAKLPPPPPPPPVDDLTKPRAVPADEAERLVRLGVRSFRDQDYGVAARRFQQALDADPAHDRAAFLLAQSRFAHGQFRESVRAIEDGLARRQNWPAVKFEPRTQLYGKDDDAWREHLSRLEGVVKARPLDADFRFLLAYQLWFGGDRAEASALFREARALTADPAPIDLFLKPGPVAVK